MSFFTVDIGVNYAKKSVGEVKTIMSNAWNEGVAMIVLISNSPKEWNKNINLCKEIGEARMTLGCHPHSASQFKDSDLSRMETLISNHKIIAVGECGLDYNRMFSPKDVQQKVFRQQIEFAKTHDLQLYLHCRGSRENPEDAFNDMIEILSEYDYYNGAVHCFTGNVDQAVKFTSLGFKLGITGWIYDKRRNKELVGAIKDDRIKVDMLLVETDAPYMPILPKRKKTRKSLPEDTGDVVMKIAELKGLDCIETGQQIYNNSLDFLQRN
jgi:TatD DNase family protein